MLHEYRSGKAMAAALTPAVTIDLGVLVVSVDCANAEFLIAGL
jgi:hypothetical protein